MTLIPWKMGSSLVWDATWVDTLAPYHLPENVPKLGLVLRLDHRTHYNILSIERLNPLKTTKGANGHAWTWDSGLLESKPWDYEI